VVKNNRTKKEKQNETNRKKIEVDFQIGILLTLWGLAAAFAVQIVYDYVGSMLPTSQAKLYFGILIVAVLIVALLLYARHPIGPQKGKKL
jgi:hypothetical protein